MSHPPDSSHTDDGFPVIRTIGLVIVALVMIWLALTVRLPGTDALRDRIDDFGFWSWAVFILVYAGVALTPIPVTVMALAGGLLFGVTIGSVLSVIGAMLGSLAGYAIARGLGRETVLQLLGSRRKTLEERLEDAGFEAVFTLRVLPGMPYWPINYAAGPSACRSRCSRSPPWSPRSRARCPWWRSARSWASPPSRWGWWSPSPGWW